LRGQGTIAGTRRRRALGVGLLAALAAAGAALALSTTPAKARPLETGITNLYTDAPLAFQRTRAAGASFVRIPLHWAGTVPGAEPVGWRPEDPGDPN